MLVLDNTTEIGPPIGQPSIFLVRYSLPKNIQPLYHFVSNFLNVDFLQKDSCEHYFM